MRLLGLKAKYKNKKVSRIDIENIFETLGDLRKSLVIINSVDVISNIHNDLLSDLHFVFMKLDEIDSSIKAIKIGIIMPKPEQCSQATISNPFLSMSMFDKLINETIEGISKTLTYLKDGYCDDFPERGGIERCAGYQLPWDREDDKIPEQSNNQ